MASNSGVTLTLKQFVISDTIEIRFWGSEYNVEICIFNFIGFEFGPSLYVALFTTKHLLGIFFSSSISKCSFW
jgi:hypothetical protein